MDGGGEQEGPARAWRLDDEDWDWAMMVTSWRDDDGVDDQRFPPKRMGEGEQPAQQHLERENLEALPSKSMTANTFPMS